MKPVRIFKHLAIAVLAPLVAGCIIRASGSLDPETSTPASSGHETVPATSTTASSSPETVPAASVPAAASPAELDSKAAFSFAIISDNKGDSPEDCPEFARTAAWIEEAGDSFVLGLGDHIKKGWKNSFLRFVMKDEWWRRWFIPGIADGENEYYGRNQGDWGAGAPILSLVKPADSIEMQVEPNGVDFTAVIPVNDYKVHFIHGHFPDQPDEIAVAFPRSTRSFLADRVRDLTKGPRDIIVVGAHSARGSWIEFLDEQDRKILMNKADLILAATTHFFEKQDVEGWPDRGALCINTGSVSHPSKYCPPGYVQVRVFENPLRLLVQYVNAGNKNREHSIGRYSWLKVPDDKIVSAPYREERPEEDILRVVGVLETEIGKKALADELSRRMQKAVDADYAAINVAAGLPAGEVRVVDLWDALPFNNEVWSLRFTREQWIAVFDEAPPGSLGAGFDAALESYWVERIMAHLGMEKTLKKTSGVQTHDLLKEIARGETFP